MYQLLTFVFGAGMAVLLICWLRAWSRERNTRRLLNFKEKNQNKQSQVLHALSVLLDEFEKKGFVFSRKNWEIEPGGSHWIRFEANRSFGVKVSARAHFSSGADPNYLQAETDVNLPHQWNDRFLTDRPNMLLAKAFRDKFQCLYSVNIANMSDVEIKVHVQDLIKALYLYDLAATKMAKLREPLDQQISKLVLAEKDSSGIRSRFYLGADKVVSEAVQFAEAPQAAEKTVVG